MAISMLPSNIIEDIHSSGDFREHLLKNELLNIVRQMEGGF